MSGSILTIGTFDGVHLGHRKIFQEVTSRAKKLKIESAVVTFNIPPRLFFFPSEEPSLLTTVQEKKELLKSCGIDKIFVLDFDESLAHTSAQEFFKKFIVSKGRASEVIVGYNFGFGRKREGDARFLEKAGKDFGVRIKILPPVVSGSVPISSGRIREALKAGDLKTANALLGGPYGACGKVVVGQRLGSKLGFPTANLQADDNKIIPMGVFAVQAVLPGGKVLGGMANAGFRPTVTGLGEKKRSLEVHLFKFKGNLYGKTLRIKFLEKIRDERAFPGLEDLRRQIEKDKVRAEKVLDTQS